MDSPLYQDMSITLVTKTNIPHVYINAYYPGDANA